jgi:hypothetical protein
MTKITLWKHHVSEDFHNGRTDKATVKEGGHLKADLGELIEFCKNRWQSMEYRQSRM